MDTKRKTVNSAKEYVDFVASILSGWQGRSIAELKKVHGAPESYPCTVVAEFYCENEDIFHEDYGMGPSPSWHFGVEKMVKRFIPFSK